MEILLLILKIIGVLLAVIFLLLLTALAVPVRYGIRMEAQDDITGTAAFSWFCRLLSLNIAYKEKQTAFRLRILGIPVSLGKEKKKRSAKRRKRKKGRKENGSAKSAVLDAPKEDEAPVLETAKMEKLPGSEKPKEKRTGRKRKRAKGWRKKLRESIETLRQWIADMKDRTVTGKEKFQNIKKLISEETNKKAILHLLQELKFLTRHYAPRKASGELDFAIGDPGRTGQVLGLFSFVPFWSRYRIHVIPDFQADSFYVRGRLQIKGRIRAWHVLWSAFRLIKDKNIRALTTSFRT
ncbi:hypothetical protein D3Z36_00985 [Lachnospiraceae bacterium]|nr:hypothetical protein [Lachnospiraceae bacterium]